jgi:DNA-binding transcriptional LysR family regulator
MAGLVPRALATLPADLVVTAREGSTPALVRALRAGTIDLAVLAVASPFRPLDEESPPLRAETLTERELLVAVGPGHPFAAGVGITTVPALLVPHLPEGVRAVAVRGEPQELRRVVLVAAPGAAERPERLVVADALREAAGAR